VNKFVLPVIAVHFNRLFLRGTIVLLEVFPARLHIKMRNVSCTISSAASGVSSRQAAETAVLSIADTIAQQVFSFY